MIRVAWTLAHADRRAAAQIRQRKSSDTIAAIRGPKQRKQRRVLGYWKKRAVAKRKSYWREIESNAIQTAHTSFGASATTPCRLRFGRVYVIQPYREFEKCAPACWNATGFTCECSCMGKNHGSMPGGRWWVVADTFAIQWQGRRLACRLIERAAPLPKRS